MFPQQSTFNVRLTAGNPETGFHTPNKGNEQRPLNTGRITLSAGCTAGGYLRIRGVWEQSFFVMYLYINSIKKFLLYKTTYRAKGDISTLALERKIAVFRTFQSFPLLVPLLTKSPNWHESGIYLFREVITGCIKNRCVSFYLRKGELKC